MLEMDTEARAQIELSPLEVKRFIDLEPQTVSLSRNSVVL